MKVQHKPIEWMVSNGGIPVRLIWNKGVWAIGRPGQFDPPTIGFSPEGNEQLQPLSEFLAEAEAALSLKPEKSA